MKKLITTLLSIYLLLLVPYSAYAKTGGYNDWTTLGSCDPPESFKLAIYDDDSNVEKLIISIDDNNTPISHPDLFKSGGVKGNFQFIYYNPITKNLYSFGDDVENAKYSSDYNVDTEKPIRLLSGSYINIIEDDGFFTGSNDNIKLNFTFNGESNNISIIKNSSGDFGISEGDCDLDFDYEQFFESIDMHLNVEIPLTKILPGQTIVNRDGIDIISAPSSSSNLNMPLVDKAYAEIVVNKDGIQFYPWRTKEALQTGSGKNIDSVPEKIEIEKKPTKYGLTGYGFELPKKGSFKGISTNTSLEETIVGITNFVLSFVAVIAVLVLIYGGYLWIMDAGEDQLAEKSRKVIASAIIGILLIISAYTIINTIIELEDAYPEGCEIRVDNSGGVTSGELDCGSGATNAMIGAGISGVMDMF